MIPAMAQAQGDSGFCGRRMFMGAALALAAIATHLFAQEEAPSKDTAKADSKQAAAGKPAAAEAAKEKAELKAKVEKAAKPAPNEAVEEGAKASKDAAKAVEEAVKAAKKAANAAKVAPNEKAEAPPPPIAQPPIIVPRAVGRGRIRGGFRRVINSADGAADVNYALFPTNRELVRQLERASEMIKEDRFADAFDLLDDILGEKQDFFHQPNREEQTHRSLKAQARQMIGGLPKEALEQYDVQFGATARRLLDQAIADGDQGALTGVVRRYFNTQAGFEAAWLLGRQHLDHGQSLAAALIYQMLYDAPRAREKYEPALSLVLATCWVRAGVPARAQVVLRELRKTSGRLRVGPKEVPLFQDDAKAIEWLLANVGAPLEAVAAQLTHWSLHRGNAARNATSSGGSPLLTTPRWQQALASEPQPTPAREAMTRQLADTNQVSLPAETPLAVGDMAIVRSPRWLVGINLRNGKRIWEYETWESENYTPRQQVINPMTSGLVTIRPEKFATRSTLSSDGRLVFVVEDRGNQPFVYPGVFNPWGRGASPSGPGSYNKLSARELATQGKLVWEVGGESGEDEPQLAGAYFLGAPLAMGGQAYVIGELKGEITLFVLETATGKLTWSQPLATVETTVGLDSFRRLHGAMPSFVDGVIVAPTAAGAVVAVDLANRSLLWGYQYPRTQVVNPYVNRRNGEGAADPFGTGGGRWTDGAAILASGRALIAPPDSEQLHCINIVDGKLAWKPIDRSDKLYIGAVHRDVVLLVGRRQVQGIKLSDGQPAWPPQNFAVESAAAPSGRGFLSAGHYYLPLTSGEVVKIDLADGQIKARAKSRKSYVPGNLISHQGNVLSLTDDSLDCFFQLDEREQWASDTLRDRPNDPDALAMYGEILIDQGKLAEGLGHLQRAFELAPNERIRELLIEAHLESLRKDFATYRAGAGEIEKLLSEPAQKTAFARQMAIGLQEQGEHMAAFEYYVKMCQPGQESLELEDVVPQQLSVRRDRWVQAKIAELRSQANDDERQKMDTVIAAHLESLGGPTSVAAVRQFLNYFGNHESAAALRNAYVDRLIDQNKILEAEWWLLRQARSGNKQQAAAAYLRLADWMLRLERPEDAASCYRQLALRFPEQTAADGKTAKQVVESLAADAPVRRFLALEQFWPKAVVNTEVVGRTLESVSLPLELTAGRDPYFSHLTLEMDNSRQELVVRDGFGAERLRVSLAENRRINYSGYPWARANGHILLIQAGSQILAIDAVGSEKDGKSRILWRHDLSESLGEAGAMSMQAQQGPNRRMQQRLVDQNGQPMGGIWPVGHELVCLQRGSKLLAIDVQSGQVLWTRHDIRPAGEIFGDDEYVFVVAATGNEATVLRALDGTKLGQRSVPPVGHRYSTYGRKVVSFVQAGGKLVLRVLDCWTGEDWQRPLAAGAKMDMVGAEEVAVLDPLGNLVVYSLEDDELKVDTQVRIDPPLTDLQVFRTPDRYVVLAVGATHRPGMANMQAVQAAGGSRQTAVAQGRAIGFDRQGRLLWHADIGPTATLVNQPAHVPVLVFAMNTNEQVNGNRQKSSTGLFCLDTRNGKVLLDQKVDNASNTVVAFADPATQTLEIRASAGGVKLTFGEKKGEVSDKNGDAKDGADTKVDENKGDDKTTGKPAQPRADVPRIAPADDPFGPTK